MWKKADFSEIKNAIKFISRFEYNYMSITSRFTKNSRIINNRNDNIFIKIINSEIMGVLFAGRYGLLSSKIILKNHEDEDIPELIYQYRQNVYSIMGEAHETDYLLTIFKKKGINEKISIDYVTMSISELNNKLPSCPNNFKIYKASLKNINNLMNLQKLYEIEEVLLNKDTYNFFASLSAFKSTLKKQIVYFCSDNSRAIAKANTNAKGINYYQLGGVFVLNEYRNKGIGKAVVTELLIKIFSCNKKACLFVKKENINALALYKSLGFKKISDFKISYLL